MIQVRGSCLEERLTGAGDGVAKVQFLRLVLANRIREAVAELLVAEWNRAVPVGGVAQGDAGRAQRWYGQWEHAAEWSRADRDGCGGDPTPSENHGKQAPEGVADDHWFAIQATDESLRAAV
jgi:hypothetical protein